MYILQDIHILFISCSTSFNKLLESVRTRINEIASFIQIEAKFHISKMLVLHTRILKIINKTTMKDYCSYPYENCMRERTRSGDSLVIRSSNCEDCDNLDKHSISLSKISGGNRNDFWLLMKK